MQEFELLLPSSFQEASNLIADHNAKPIAGGTAMMILMKERILQPETVVSLRPLRDEHDYIELEDGQLRIGALTPLRSIETHELIRAHVPVISDCLAELASIRIRTMATIGGHLAHGDPDLDLPPVLAGLGAEVGIQGPDSTRSVPLTDFITGFYETDLGEGELIKDVRVPVEDDRDGVYLKHRSLSEADWPCIGVAAFLGGDRPAPTVFLTAVSDTPILRVGGLAEAFDGAPLEEAIEAAGRLASEQCDPIGDARGSADYKRRMADVITQRALNQVFDKTEAA
ncbi:MAG: xanthine dehydrogenase family protein subunit M [Halobacteriales archaeon]|nr:xanthine dehydrogenase family protein subunit M [Halobacteriales archaeon]